MNDLVYKKSVSFINTDKRYTFFVNSKEIINEFTFYPYTSLTLFQFFGNEKL